MDITNSTDFNATEGTENILSDCKQLASQVLHDAPIEEYTRVAELFERSVALANHEFVSLPERIGMFHHVKHISLLCREIRQVENNILSTEQINECKEIFSRLLAFENKVSKRKKFCATDEMNRFEGRVLVGVATGEFLKKHGLTSGPRDDKDERVVTFDDNFNLLRPTPAERLQYYYTAKGELCYIVFAGTVILAQIFSRLYYSTSGNGQFLQLKEHIDQHEQYKHLYRERDRIDGSCQSIEATLEKKIMERDDRIRKVEVFYDYEEEQLYARKFYYGGWNHSETPETVSIDSEIFGYVNYNPDKHGSPGHFFMRYSSKYLFDAIIARSNELPFHIGAINPRKQSDDLKLLLAPDSVIPMADYMKDRRLHDSPVGYYKRDAEGCTIWDRMIARMRKEGNYCNNLLYIILYNFEHSYYFLKRRTCYPHPLIPLTSVLYQKFHPFFLQNTRTKDTFFHLVVRELSQKEHSVETSLYWLFISLYRYVIRGDDVHRYGINFHEGTLKSSRKYPTKEWCDMVVMNIDPTEIMQRLQILHGLFTMRNAEKQTPMDILSKQVLTNHDHKEDNFSLLFVQILSHLLYALAQLYEITEYDNLIARFVPLFDEELEELPEDPTLTARQEGNRMYLPLDLTGYINGQNCLNEIRAEEEERLSEIPPEEVLKKTRAIFRQKLYDIILGLFEKRGGNSVFENFMQSHFAWYHQRARIHPECPETEAVIAKFLYRVFFHEEFPLALRSWFLKSFGEDSETQVSRLTDFFVSLTYHHHQPGYGIPFISRSLLGFVKDVWHSFSSDQMIEGVKAVWQTIKDKFIANGQNLEKTVKEILGIVAEAQEPSECFKKKSLSTPTHFLWRIIMGIWNVMGKLWEMTTKIRWR